MIVRALDANGDWTFGRGQNNYVSGNQAIAQLLQTRIRSFLGDCFFDTGAGVDWFNLLGGKNRLAIQMAVSGVILNTYGVSGITNLSLNLGPNRNLTISYSINTIFPGGISGDISLLLSQ